MPITKRRQSLEERCKLLGLTLTQALTPGSYNTTAHWWALERTDVYGTWQMFAGLNLDDVERVVVRLERIRVRRDKQILRAATDLARI